MSDSKLPEAYQVGWVPFIHTKIWLDSHPLIPRPETEYWVNEVIHKLKSSEAKKLRILDLCAGSGAIGIAVAKDVPGAQVDFVELDERHHQTISKNLKENGVEGRVFGGDLFQNITDTYDFILSNPPYIDMPLGRVEESVLAHEPCLALDGGKLGFDIIERILEEATEHLNPGGILWIEHEPEQVETLTKYLLYKGSFLDQFDVLRYSRFYT